MNSVYKKIAHIKLAQKFVGIHVVTFSTDGRIKRILAGWWVIAVQTRCTLSWPQHIKRVDLTTDFGTAGHWQSELGALERIPVAKRCTSERPENVKGSMFWTDSRKNSIFGGLVVQYNVRRHGCPAPNGGPGGRTFSLRRRNQFFLFCFSFVSHVWIALACRHDASAGGRQVAHFSGLPLGRLNPLMSLFWQVVLNVPVSQKWSRKFLILARSAYVASAKHIIHEVQLHLDCWSSLLAFNLLTGKKATALTI